MSSESETITKLNENTLKKLIDIILKTAKNLNNNMDHKKILKIIGEDFMLVRDYYIEIIDSLQKIEE